MKRAAIFSGILHGIILIIMILGLINPFSRKLEDQRPLMIDFVDISEITKAPIIAPMDVNEPEPAAEAPQQEPAPQPAPPPPVEQPPLPAPLPEPTPPPPPVEQPKPEPMPEPVKAPEPEPLSLPESKKEEPKKEEPKKEEKQPERQPEEKKKPEPPKKEKAEVNLTKEQPKPKVNEAKEKKKIDDDFNDIFADVSKETKKKDPSKTSGKTKGAPAEQVGEVVTAAEIDIINKTVQACWLVPNGVRGARNLVVKIRIKIAKDGTIQSAQIANPERMGDPVFRAAAESAQRAPMDPKCNKIPLNPSKYKQWETTVINFDPADMQ